MGECTQSRSIWDVSLYASHAAIWTIGLWLLLSILFVTSFDHLFVTSFVNIGKRGRSQPYLWKTDPVDVRDGMNDECVIRNKVITSKCCWAHRYGISAERCKGKRRPTVPNMCKKGEKDRLTCKYKQSDRQGKGSYINLQL